MEDWIINIASLSKAYHRLDAQDKGLGLRETITQQCRSMMKSKEPSSKEQKFLALDNINLTIHKGDKVALLGTNGSGKSTLLKVLSKITYPTSGTVRIKGKITSLIEVGTGFHPELTGAENIMLNEFLFESRQLLCDGCCDGCGALSLLEFLEDSLSEGEGARGRGPMKSRALNCLTV